ncbi:T9SS type A sorting domain-containing protein, partial [bacterium]|nr:T9SS type A sorting domain-containing protein [bacterium]
ETADSMTVIIVNRDIHSARNVTVNLSETYANDGDYPALQLAALPSGETFISHDDNALIESEVTVKLNSFSITVPALSTTAVLLNSLIITGIPANRNLSDEIKIFPNEFRLEQNCPNPFNPVTRIGYQVPAAIFVTLKVFDVLGNEIETLVNGHRIAGRYTVEFSASGLASGVYFCRIEAGTYRATRKLLLFK